MEVRVEIIGDVVIYGHSLKGDKRMWIRRVYPSRHRKSGIEVELADADGGIVLCCSHDIKKLGWID